MLIKIVTTLLSIMGISLPTKAIKIGLICVLLAVVGGAGWLTYRAVDNFFTQGKEDAATIGSLETKVDALGSANDNLSQAIETLGVIEEVKNGVRVEAKQNTEASTTKTTEIIKKKDKKIKDVIDKSKDVEHTEETVIKKEKEITLIVIDSMWEAYCKDNTSTDCKG